MTVSPVSCEFSLGFSEELSARDRRVRVSPVMCGEVVAVPGVLGVFDHQALVLGNLEAPDPSHQLGTAKGRAGGEAHGAGAGRRPISPSWPPCLLLGRTETHQWTEGPLRTRGPRSERSVPTGEGRKQVPDVPGGLVAGSGPQVVWGRAGRVSFSGIWRSGWRRGSKVISQFFSLN